MLSKSSLQRCHLRVSFSATWFLSIIERINEDTVVGVCWGLQIIRKLSYSVAIGRQESSERWRYCFSRSVKCIPIKSTPAAETIAQYSLASSSLHWWCSAPLSCCVELGKSGNVPDAEDATLHVTIPFCDTSFCTQNSWGNSNSPNT